MGAEHHPRASGASYNIRERDAGGRRGMDAPPKIVCSPGAIYGMMIGVLVSYICLRTVNEFAACVPPHARGQLRLHCVWK